LLQSAILDCTVKFDKDLPSLFPDQEKNQNVWREVLTDAAKVTGDFCKDVQNMYKIVSEQLKDIIGKKCFDKFWEDTELSYFLKLHLQM
jgi:hypothetical protein